MDHSGLSSTAQAPAATSPQKSMEYYTGLRRAAKGNKSLSVGLNLFYKEGSLQGSAEQKAENYCMMCSSTGAWKHSRNATYKRCA